MYSSQYKQCKWSHTSLATKQKKCIVLAAVTLLCHLLSALKRFSSYNLHRFHKSGSTTNCLVWRSTYSSLPQYKTHTHSYDLKGIIIKALRSLCSTQQGLDGPYVSLYSHKICLWTRVRNGHVRAGRSLLLNCTQQRLISRYEVPHGELPASLN